MYILTTRHNQHSVFDTVTGFRYTLSHKNEDKQVRLFVNTCRDYYYDDDEAIIFWLHLADVIMLEFDDRNSKALVVLMKTIVQGIQKNRT